MSNKSKSAANVLLQGICHKTVYPFWVPGQQAKTAEIHEPFFEVIWHISRYGHALFSWWAISRGLAVAAWWQAGQALLFLYRWSISRGLEWSMIPVAFFLLLSNFFEFSIIFWIREKSARQHNFLKSNEHMHIKKMWRKYRRVPVLHTCFLLYFQCLTAWRCTFITVSAYSWNWLSDFQ